MCREHGQVAALDSENVVLCAVEALLKGDIDTVQAIYDGMTSFDGHVAITLLAYSLLANWQIAGADPTVSLNVTKERVNVARAKILAESAGGSETSDQ